MRVSLQELLVIELNSLDIDSFAKRLAETIDYRGKIDIWQDFDSKSFSILLLQVQYNEVPEGETTLTPGDFAGKGESIDVVTAICLDAIRLGYVEDIGADLLEMIYGVRIVCKEVDRRNMN